MTCHTVMTRSTIEIEDPEFDILLIYPQDIWLCVDGSGTLPPANTNFAWVHQHYLFGASLSVVSFPLWLVEFVYPTASDSLPACHLSFTFPGRLPLCASLQSRVLESVFRSKLGQDFSSSYLSVLLPIKQPVFSQSISDLYSNTSEH